MSSWPNSAIAGPSIVPPSTTLTPTEPAMADDDQTSPAPSLPTTTELSQSEQTTTEPSQLERTSTELSQSEQTTSSQNLDSQPSTSPDPAPEAVWSLNNDESEQQLDARSELISQARSFLVSPQVQHQDIFAKRRFLADKGLTDVEIEHLLRELPPQVPVLPPRSYPRPPPSNILNLLLGLARIFTWVLGGSAVLIFFYHRFLLPRLIASTNARQSLLSHHLSLMRNLTSSISSFKEHHAKNFSSVPRAQPYKEPAPWVECKTIGEILKLLDDHNKEVKLRKEANKRKKGVEKSDIWDVRAVPEITLLRCAIAEFSNAKETSKPSTQELFMLLEAKIPWFASEEGIQHQDTLYQKLSNTPLFTSDTSDTASAQSLGLWTYTPPPSPTPSPLISSLSSLTTALPPPLPASKPPTSLFQPTLQALTDFTGYISAQVYVPHRGIGMGAGGSTGALGGVEEELKREIRALKGLVLNRRSFMPSRPPSTVGYLGAP